MNPLPLLPSLPSTMREDASEYLAQQLGWLPTDAQRARELISVGLPPLVTVTTLPFLLGVSPQLLRHISEHKRAYCRRFEIPKRDGSPRQIDAPRVVLKLIQRYLKDHVVDKMSVHPAAHAYRVGQNIFSGAEPHVGARHLLSLDVKDFFPSVTEQKVAELFGTMGYPAAVCESLAGLCTLEGGLPQGAPSSPGLSNAAFLSCDLALSNLAVAWHARYTRYADDMTFSSSEKRFVAEDVATVAAALRQSGFELNHRKTKLIGGGYRHQTAGLSAGPDRVAAPRWRRRRWRALFHAARQEPSAFLGQSTSLQGVAAFVNEYDEVLGAEYAAIARRVQELERMPPTR